MYTILTTTHSPSTLLEIGVDIGDYVFTTSTWNVGVAIVHGVYDEGVLASYLERGLITAEVKALYLNCPTEEGVTIYPIEIPPCIWGQGIETADDLKRHLEYHTVSLYGESIINYLDNVIGVASASDMSEIVTIYANIGKLIIIKLLR